MREGRVAITIAIDGPAASGKSTTARAVADRLGYSHLNSGLVYRVLTWAALHGGWVDDPDFDARLSALSIAVRRDPPSYRILVDGADPGEALAAPETAARVSEVAARAAVRDRVLELLRKEGASGGLVCDGRDIGTVVFPEAELKVFLVASANERARRRLVEQGREPTPERVAREIDLLAARDLADATRDLAPLRKAGDAVEIDSTGSSPEDVVARIVALALQRASTPG